MQRRSFLQKLIYSASALAAGSVPYGLAYMMAPPVMAESRNIVLPPGALKDPDEFNKACIGCGLCGEVCPPRCIRFHKMSGKHKLNTPYIDVAEKGCILCNKCMEICPTEALTEMPREKIDMGIAQIDRAACYPWVDKGICGACVLICPLAEKAIGFDFANIYRPVVKEGCVGCGLCVEVCPHPSQPIWVVERSQGTIVKHRV